MTSISQGTIYAMAAGLSVFGITLYLCSVYRDYLAARQRFAARAEPEEQQVRSFLLRILKPMAQFIGHLIGNMVARLQRRYGEGGFVSYLVKLRIKLQRLLTAAGNPEGLSADDLLGLNCISVAAWGLLGVLAWAMLGSSFPILLLGLIGLVQPTLWLRKKITQRRTAIRRLMPYALDLLTLSVEAGLDFTAALGRMVPKLGNTALSQEFGEVLREIRLGRSRSEALREMADRVNMGEVTAFCSSLIQADELGADLGPVLRVLADQMRDQRANLAEKKAMEAPVKIMFPLIAFIFPTVFIILFAPIGIDYLQDLFGG